MKIPVQFEQKNSFKVKCISSTGSQAEKVTFQISLTSSFVKYPVSDGVTKPGIVPKVFVNPISIPAYLGPMSKWLDEYEPMLKAKNPVAITIQATDHAI